jgi:hypothetical protein
VSAVFSEGDVIVYPYRWRSERDEGRFVDGAKERPCCLVLLVTDSAGRETVILAPVSSKPPRADQTAIEIPEIERRRAGLEGYPQAWVFVDEVNADRVADSWYLEPQAPLGAFGRSFLAKVAAGIRAHAGKGKIVVRR